MKILQVCKQFPYPLRDGYSVAVNALSKALVQLGSEVTLLSMNTSKHYFDLSELPADYNHYKKIHTVDIDNRISPIGAFLNLFSSESYIVSRFISKSFSEKLSALFEKEQYDIIQLESVQLAAYIPVIRQFSNAKIAMRSHNVEYEIWERHAASTKFLLKKWYLNSQVKAFRKFEIRHLKDYDILVSITHRDLDIFRKQGFQNAATVIPVGMDSNYYQANWETYKNEISISFIGSLDWMPNQEGVFWFLENVWNDLKARFPDLQLHIAGRHTPDWLKEKATKGVVFHGEVESAVDFMNAHSLMIVPLFSGSGIRVKILEGMALGRVILTTTLGKEGIEAVHQKEILISDTAEAFIENVDFCFRNKKQLKEIGSQARNFIKAEFDNLSLAEKLLESYNSLTFSDNLGGQTKIEIKSDQRKR